MNRKLYKFDWQFNERALSTLNVGDFVVPGNMTSFYTIDSKSPWNIRLSSAVLRDKIYMDLVPSVSVSAWAARKNSKAGFFSSLRETEVYLSAFDGLKALKLIKRLQIGDPRGNVFLEDLSNLQFYATVAEDTVVISGVNSFGGLKVHRMHASLTAIKTRLQEFLNKL